MVFMIVKALNKLKRETPKAAPTTKKCPFCKSGIALEAIRCPHCTSQLDEEQVIEITILQAMWNRGV
ncbi:MAG: hypothetical protein K2O34_00620 [Acetatifactor sp.]|nr:hypothetical protein [Acetatifactor sp.]